MIDQNQEQLKINQQFFSTDHNAIIKFNLPKQTQEQIQKTIGKSNSMLRNISDKQLLSQKLGSVYYKNQAKLRLSPFEIYDDKDRQITQKQILSMSILPLLSKIVFEHFQNLVNIELQINPMTKKLIQTPKGIPVVEFVSDFATVKTLSEKFDKIDDEFDIEFDEQKRIALWRPLFTFVFNCLSKLSFLVSPALFKQILWNRYIPEPITEDKLAEHRQGQLRKKLEQVQLQNSQKKDAYQDKVTQLMVQTLVKNRQKLNQPEHHFFKEITEVNQYDKIVQTALDTQIKSLTDFSTKVKDILADREITNQHKADKEREMFMIQDQWLQQMYRRKQQGS